MVTEKNEIEYEDESEMLAHLIFSVNQKSEGRIGTIFYPIEYYCNSFKLSIETFGEKFRPIGREKYEIEYRQKSMEKFSSFGSDQILMQ